MISVRRTAHHLKPNVHRVLAKPYLPGEEIAQGNESRASLLMERICAIPESEVPALFRSVYANFATRHHRFEALLEANFAAVARYLGARAANLSRERRLLIGAFYTQEYSVEGAALFNPSIFEAPDQRGLPAGSRRVIMSVRAVGEGHISSIGFRTGVLDAASTLTFDALGTALVPGARTPPVTYDKRKFAIKLGELGATNELAGGVLARLGAAFTLSELDASLAVLEADGTPQAITFETAKIMRMLAASSYATTFPTDSEVSERVLFPAGPHETRGMEDARFVRFAEDDGGSRYFATYTAYDGFGILPQLIETTDFVSFSISTLSGDAAQNKGMALFPRKIGGRYVMLSRKDRENLHLSTSEDVHVWNDLTLVDRPHAPWELVQIGNCGSPIETDAGWLVLTHGVGPMRRYVLSAVLLDLDEPSRVIGRLSEPLLEPNEAERDGYVPNVVYSCGALQNGNDLVLPYGMSDGAIGMALVDVRELLASLRANA
jgi:predicted GH43/DUF377 family glycosyl hydrolase